MCMVALGVIQQYYIYLKTAIFFNKKVVTLLYLWLAAALAAWYNTINMCGRSELFELSGLNGKA